MACCLVTSLHLMRFVTCLQLFVIRNEAVIR